MRREGGQHRVPDHAFALRDRYVCVAGEIASVVVEEDEDERKIDHVWVQVRAGDFGRVEISLSTTSRQSRALGFDPRVRVGTIRSTWSELPPSGVRPITGPLDYASLEAQQPVEYTPLERTAVERLLIDKARGAMFVEAWGEFYIRAHIGIHQIHSRRASHAIPRDVIGKDGAIRFYFREANASKLLLFKYDGQP
ncbi:MAG: hypothetical protein AVDCRST_MAG42-2370 [uncultured Chthoniobacterales bacterium]|uniref:Uncharacterized protein n=1 Tax=uncultured Chthoniobacterales bacterium TaxID=1836801 RepID=A0A6J4IJ53_9BACT|nr:MAG: hypothetical protein AVDCRST_MAG42-2370 [uncultured Chthoniobacterales bacterium]